MTGAAGDHRVVLRDDRGPQGTWSERATLSGAGLRVEGQSLRVEGQSLRGDDGYEFAVDVAPGQFPALLAALGAPAHADVLDALAAWSRGGGRGLTRLLQDAGVEHRLWNRVGG
ncbi:hypothetical protein ACI798_01540 [Geodermatophilus sp. SYSU D01045]